MGYYCDVRPGSSGSPVLAYSDHAVVSLHRCGTCPNRGVPVTVIISDLGPDLPNNAEASACTVSEDPEVSCADGEDKDCDRRTDADDLDCCTVTEDPEVSCSDSEDNDCDGDPDAADSDCPRCAAGAIDFSSFPLTAYSIQNISNGVEVLDARETYSCDTSITHPIPLRAIREWEWYTR